MSGGRLAGSIRRNPAMAGMSVRYSPGDRETAKAEETEALKRLLLPKEDPAQEIYEEFSKLQQLPREKRLAYGVKATNFAPLSGRKYNWLKNRITNPKVDLHLPGLNEGHPIAVEDGRRAAEVLSKRVNGLNSDYTSIGLMRPIIHPQKGEMNAIYIRPDLEGQSRFNTLAHEAGHAVAGHGDSLRDLTRAQREYEAQAIAYGVQNRFYPWQSQPLKLSAAYARIVDGQTMKAFKEDRLPANETHISPQYLTTPEAKNAINSVVQKLVPNPRKPFKNIIPDFWESIS